MFTSRFICAMTCGDATCRVSRGSLTARWTTESFRNRFRRAHEGAHEFLVDLRGDGVDVDAGGGEEFSGVFDTIDARRLDFDLVESGGLEFVAIVVFF